MAKCQTSKDMDGLKMGRVMACSENWHPIHGIPIQGIFVGENDDKAVGLGGLGAPLWSFKPLMTHAEGLLMFPTGKATTWGIYRNVFFFGGGGGMVCKSK